jgi:sulfur carrier protein
VVLTINGEKRTLPEVHNVAELLTHFQLEKKILVVELNRTIVDREQYRLTPLTDGDALEIVHFVGGG